MPATEPLPPSEHTLDRVYGRARQLWWRRRALPVMSASVFVLAVAVTALLVGVGAGTPQRLRTIAPPSTSSTTVLRSTTSTPPPSLVAAPKTVPTIRARVPRAAPPNLTGEIAFQRQMPDTTGIDVFAISLATGKERQLTQTGKAHSPAWSKDGSKLAFVNYGGPSAEIYVVNRDGTGQHAVTNSGGNKESVSWSPDGTQLAFEQATSQRFDLYIVNVDGSGLRMLPTGASAGHPAWSPDGSTIAFTSIGGTSSQIHTISVNGLNERPVTTGTSADRDPSWSPDGRRIAFVSDRIAGHTGVFGVDRQGGPVVNLADDAASPSWSPDGSGITFDRQSAIYVMSTDGGNQHKVTASLPPACQQVANDLRTCQVSGPSDSDPSWT